MFHAHGNVAKVWFTLISPCNIHLHTTYPYPNHTHTKKHRQPSQNPSTIFDRAFPVVILFDINRDTDVLNYVFNKEKNDAVSNLYIDMDTLQLTHDKTSSQYILTANMDTMALLHTMHEELQMVEADIFEDLDHLDQDTGAAFAALLPALWAVRVNRYLQTPHAHYGDAVAVVPGVIRSTITEYIIVQSMRTVSTRLGSNNAIRFLFLAEVGTDNVDTMDFARDLFQGGELLYIHTGVCEESISRIAVATTCESPYPAMLLTPYTSFSLKNTQLPLLEQDLELLSSERDLRSILGIRTIVHVVADYACPSHMYTHNINNHAGHRQRVCAACQAGSYFSDTHSQCMPCINTAACINESPSFILHKCSWTYDEMCVDCEHDVQVCVDRVTNAI